MQISIAGWKVLVMDSVATRVISSALTMYDIMERRVTLVEQLAINRQPFPEMDVIYLASPTVENARKISADFENRQKAKYGNVHLFFLNSVGNDVFAVIQSNPLLVSKVKTFKEINLDFLATETSTYQLDLPNSLERLYGVSPDSSFPAFLGKKLVNMCVTLNEHPCIRYQGSSPFARDIATALHQGLLQYKRANPTFWCNGEDKHNERERAQILILDRSFDPLSPLMHEYTYQAMINDLLDVSDGVISYKTTTNKGEDEKQALLNESDEFWMDLRHQHIAKVIASIRERMSDIIQNNPGAQLAKKNGGELTITEMAAAVKKLPEYNQTMTKLGQHVALSQQCMDAFTRQGLMNLSQMEQTISTGFDEEGKEVKGQKLFQMVSETLRSPISRDQKIRLLAIYYVSQRNIPGSEDFIRQAFAAARLNNTDQQTITNFERILACSQTPAAVDEKKSGGMFSAIFGGGKTTKHAATAEGEYFDTRHVCMLKAYLEQLVAGNLPLDKFPAMGPSVAAGPKSEAKSVRRFGATSRFGKKDNVQFSGGRYMVFIAGGASFAELRVAYELMQKESKEIIVGSTHITNPDTYLVDVGSLHSPSNTVAKREDML